MRCDVSRIMCVGAFSVAELFAAVDRASVDQSIRLLIIDSITLPFMNTLKWRTMIGRFGVKLRTFAFLNAAVCLVTNYCFEEEWMPPMLGEAWSEFVDQRIQMYRSPGVRVACLAKCVDRSGNCRAFKLKCAFSVNAHDFSINSEEIT